MMSSLTELPEGVLAVSPSAVSNMSSFMLPMSSSLRSMLYIGPIGLLVFSFRTWR